METGFVSYTAAFCPVTVTTSHSKGITEPTWTQSREMGVSNEVPSTKWGVTCPTAGARVIVKAHPEEKVGVFACREGHVEVVEYSEMDPQEAASVDPGDPHLNLVCLGTSPSML